MPHPPLACSRPKSVQPHSVYHNSIPGRRRKKQEQMRIVPPGWGQQRVYCRGVLQSGSGRDGGPARAAGAKRTGPHQRSGPVVASRGDALAGGKVEFLLQAAGLPGPVEPPPAATGKAQATGGVVRPPLQWVSPGFGPDPEVAHPPTASSLLRPDRLGARRGHLCQQLAVFCIHRFQGSWGQKGLPTVAAGGGRKQDNGKTTCQGCQLANFLKYCFYLEFHF